MKKFDLSQHVQYLALRSEASRVDKGGLKPYVRYMERQDIIDLANAELEKDGKKYPIYYQPESVDVVVDDDGGFYLQMPPEEEFKLAIAKLNDAGRLFMIFPATQIGAEALIEESQKYGKDLVTQVFALIEEVKKMPDVWWWHGEDGQQ